MRARLLFLRIAITGWVGKEVEYERAVAVTRAMVTGGGPVPLSISTGVWAPFPFYDDRRRGRVVVGFTIIPTRR